MNNAADALHRVPLHLLGFGVPFGILTWFGGWAGAVALFAWRTYAEYMDWHTGAQTLAGAAIDLGAQTIIPVVIAVARIWL